MSWICFALLAGFSVFCFLNRNYKKEKFAKLNRKQHFLRFLYPACARITDQVDVLSRGIVQKSYIHALTLLKSLYIKENVDDELYIYRIQKCSVIAMIMAGACFAMSVSAIAGKTPEKVESLKRPSYGNGSVSYELDVNYGDEEEHLSVNVDQVKLDESHILELFDKSRDEVGRIMLGDNESADEVSLPLNLITEFNGFDIWWDIEDTSLIGFNGELKKEIEEGQSCVLNLFATFSMDGVSQLYNFPVCLVSLQHNGAEALKKRILQEIENINDAYQQEIELPDKLDGEPLSFFHTARNNVVIILLLAVTAAAAIWLLYDKRLEKSVRQRQEQMMTDFSRIVSKLNLLYGAGLSVHGSFERIVADYEKNTVIDGRTCRSDYAYMEMKLALEKIRNGESEGQAYAEFGKRCALQPYIKLGNILERNICKGTKGMQEILTEEAHNAYEQRKRLARKKAEQASTKMLLPMTMLMLVVIAIMAFPAMLSIRM